MRAAASALAIALILPWPSYAETACPSHFFGGIAPVSNLPQLSVRTSEICKESFAVLHSGVAAVPLWSAQRLTKEAVLLAKQVDRVDSFHAETALPDAERAEPAHYRGSGYDRGHLAPAADMSTYSAQEESFSLANVFPQVPSLNRRLWAHVEAAARGLALSYGEVYVVTGVTFHGDRVSRIGGRVLVPSAVYKAVMVPSAGAGAAWWSPNAEPGKAYETVSLDDLRRRTGIDHFPAVKDEVKRAGAALPEPSPVADRVEGSNSGETAAETRGRPDETGASFVEMAYRVLKWFLR